MTARNRTRIRALQACQECATTKTKCDNGSPCQRCARRGLRCVRDIDIQDWGTDRETEYSNALATSLERNAETLGNDFRGIAEALGAAMITPSASLTDTQVAGAYSTCESASQDTSMIPPCAAESDPLGAGRDMPAGRRENDNFDLTTQDAEFLAAFPDIFLETESRDHLFMTPEQDFGMSEWIMEGSSSVQATAAAAAPAGAPSPGYSLPTPTEDVSGQNPFRFDFSVRDHLLAFAVDACEPEHLSTVVSAFPTCEGLETLARTFLSWHAEQEDTFIHKATFIVAEVRTELLMAVVAGGAVRSSSQAVQRFGFALHRVLGIQLAKLTGKLEKPASELQFLQAYALYNHIGLWSSNERTIEMAQGGNGSLLSILRGSGRLRQSSYSHVSISGNTGLTPDGRWRKWITEESYKRLVFYVFVHSNQESIMTFGTTPLSYFELTLPFPITKRVWAALSDQVWQENMTQLSDGNVQLDLSITDCLADLSRLVSLSNAYDQTLSRLLLLYALSPMIQSYRHLHMAPTWNCGADSSGDHFSDNMHYHWLLRPFENLKNIFELYDLDTGSSTTSQILMEMLHLHLHTPLDHLELLTGKTGPAEAQASYKLVCRWVGSRMARRSAWYAGQLLGKIQDLPSATMTDFHCIIVYQALLCLWAYGSISNGGSETGAMGGQQVDVSLAGEEIDIPLDSMENTNTKKWISDPMFSVGKLDADSALCESDQK
ncbi:hypothetical protein PFICI_14457 [Pestalotiopsis fici W106-1]|uniref:Zn(2)-C6 fungal-type domain-containing protein n=1 Tax=Pestalotiopsis fici (strain W106-1 / CGMCC3.15140) TaxID=1229662 RepID=W3WL20_PESFW|nr:uncharacterized protein PFICI_14457 [Pestalotiopsis fici W106-1]ETS73511.1 hypothetical protein PFICI_14457 [Pestalotiopsis fici W106-1]